jgi:hypothetical protein
MDLTAFRALRDQEQAKNEAATAARAAERDALHKKLQRQLRAVTANDDNELNANSNDVIIASLRSQLQTLDNITKFESACEAKFPHDICVRIARDGDCFIAGAHVALGILRQLPDGT